MKGTCRLPRGLVVKNEERSGQPTAYCRAVRNVRALRDTCDVIAAACRDREAKMTEEVELAQRRKKEATATASGLADQVVNSVPLLVSQTEVKRSEQSHSS